MVRSLLMLVVVLALLALLPAGATSPEYPLTSWQFVAGSDLDLTQVPAMAGSEALRSSPWGPVGESGISRAQIDLAGAPEPGPWLLLLGRLPVRETAVNGTLFPTVCDPGSGLTLCNLEGESLRSGQNTVAVHPPVRDSSVPDDAGPCLLVPPADAAWLRSAIAQPADPPAISNFAIASTIQPDGAILPRIWVNRSGAGFVLEAIAGVSLEIETDETLVRARDTELATVDRTPIPPQCLASYRDPRVPELEINVSSCAPVSTHDVSLSALPVVASTFQISTSSKTPIPVRLIVRWLPLTGGPSRAQEVGDFLLVHNDAVGFAMRASRVEGRGGTMAELVGSDEARQQEHSLRQVQMELYVLAAGAGGAPSGPAELLERALSSTRQQREGLRRYRNRLPATGKPVLDDWLKLCPLPAYTRVRLDPQRGVVEEVPSDCSPADSYFTSYFHLLVSPELERDLVSVATPHPGSTLSQALAVVRACRYAAWDPAGWPADAWLPVMEERCRLLLAKDANGDSLPDADRLEPGEAFAFLAALRGTSTLAGAHGHAATAKRLHDAWQRASDRVHAGRGDGGLWTPSGYVGLPGTSPPPANQVLGLILGELPAERIDAVLDATAPEAAENDPLYAQLGPHLTAMMAWGLLRNGRTDDGLSLLERLACKSAEQRALAAPGSISPPEGATTPVALAAVLLGWLGLERSSQDEVRLSPRAPRHDRLSASFHLPEGFVVVASNRTPTGSSAVQLSGSLTRPLRFVVSLPEATTPVVVDLPAGERVRGQGETR
ncbi:MAG: hypothetical protein AB1486_28495 [Planctomycetota bacterium]